MTSEYSLIDGGLFMVIFIQGIQTSQTGATSQIIL